MEYTRSIRYLALDQMVRPLYQQLYYSLHKGHTQKDMPLGEVPLCDEGKL